MQGVTEELLSPDQRLPLLVRPSTMADLSTLLREQRAAVTERLFRHGAILFRGFEIGDAARFAEVIAAVSSQPLEYVYRSTPRTAVGEGIFTATEYPSALEIPLHNENAYQREWPLRLAFCCIQAASEGGQTPIADMDQVNRSLGPELIDEFARRGVQYIRHYQPHVDLAWQTVFQTEDREQVGHYCREHGIDWQWLDEDVLRTTQVCQGVARHPRSGKTTWFNQAHLFHVSSAGEEAMQALLDMFGWDRLPRHARFGDGKEIPAATLAAVRTAMQSSALDIAWETGDVALLDNMQVAHGRRSYAGPRRLLAALLDPHVPPQLTPANEKNSGAATTEGMN